VGQQGASVQVLGTFFPLRLYAFGLFLLGRSPWSGGCLIKFIYLFFLYLRDLVISLRLREIKIAQYYDKSYKNLRDKVTTAISTQNIKLQELHDFRVIG
jgi:hypothetical protein